MRPVLPFHESAPGHAHRSHSSDAAVGCRADQGAAVGEAITELQPANQGSTAAAKSVARDRRSRQRTRTNQPSGFFSVNL